MFSHTFHYRGPQERRKIDDMGVVWLWCHRCEAWIKYLLTDCPEKAPLKHLFGGAYGTYDFHEWHFCHLCKEWISEEFRDEECGGLVEPGCHHPSAAHFAA